VWFHKYIQKSQIHKKIIISFDKINQKIGNYIKLKTQNQNYYLESKKYDDENYLFFKELKKSYLKNLNLYFYKPDVIINEENEELLPKYHIYNSLTDKLSLKEKRKIIEKDTKLNYLNSNNCIYFYYEVEKKQIFTISTWFLNPKEVRIGIFIEKKLIEKNKKFIELLDIFNSNFFKRIEFSEKKRGHNYLYEQIINFEGNWYDFENKKHLLYLISLLMVLILVEYLTTEQKYEGK